MSNNQEQIHKPDPGTWSVGELIQALKLAQLWAVLGGLAIIMAGAFFLGGTFSVPPVSGSDSQQQSDRGDPQVEFIDGHPKVYKIAYRMVTEIGQTQAVSKYLLNFRATSYVSQQDTLYRIIFDEVRKGEVLYTRVSTFESDTNLSITRLFLEELGEQKNARVFLTVGSPYIPSCLITDTEALLGFKGGSGKISDGLHITGPVRLVANFASMYEKILANRQYTHVVKDFDQVVSGGEIDSVISHLEERIAANGLL